MSSNLTRNKADNLSLSRKVLEFNLVLHVCERSLNIQSVHCSCGTKFHLDTPVLLVNHVIFWKSHHKEQICKLSYSLAKVQKSFIWKHDTA